MTQRAARRAAFRLGAFVLVCTTLVFVGLAVLWLSAVEGVDARRGTFAFWVTITEPVIRDFLLTALIGEALLACARIMRT